MIIGLTGGIGSGKTTVLNLFQAKENVAIYIADERAKWLMNNSETIKTQLKNIFGSESFSQGKLNKSYLSKSIFQNPDKLKRMNSIVHPAVHQDFKQFISQNAHKIIIYEAAILFETNSSDRFDFIINVSAPLHVRIKRVVERDHTHEAEVLQRVKNQLSDTHRNLQSNYVLYNVSSTEELKREVDRIYNILTKKLNFV